MKTDAEIRAEDNLLHLADRLVFATGHDPHDVEMWGILKLRILDVLRLEGVRP